MGERQAAGNAENQWGAAATSACGWIRRGDAGAAKGKGINASRGCAGSGAGTRCSTTSGVATGNAFAALTLLPNPTHEPYQAVLASMAKRNASRQRPKASGARRNFREAANDPDIRAVYHARRSGIGLARALERREFRISPMLWTRDSERHHTLPQTPSCVYWRTPTPISILISGGDNSVL
jgi:hypothetical protein